MIGKTLSHYLIERRLGAGGMGEVFLARDLALGRTAAVKVLSLLADGRGARAALSRGAGVRAAAAPGHRDVLRVRRVGRRRLPRDGVRRGRDAARSPAARGAAVSPGAVGRRVAARGARPRPRRGRPAPRHQAGKHHGDGRPPRQAARLRDRAAARGRGSRRQRGPDGGRADRGRSRHRHARLHVARAAPRKAARRAVGPLLARRRSLRGDRGAPGRSRETTPADRIAANLSAEFEPLGAAGVPADAAVVLDPRDGPRSRAPIRVRRGVSRGAARAGLGRARWPRCRTRSRSSISAISRAIPTTTGSAADSRRAWPSISRGSPAFRSCLADAVRRAAAEAGEQGRPLGQVLGCRWVLSGAYQRAGQHLRVTSQLADGITGDIVASEKVDGEVDEMFSMQDRLSAAAADRLAARRRGARRAGPPRASTSTSATNGAGASSIASKRDRSTRRRRSSRRPWPPTAHTLRPWPGSWPCTACAFPTRPTRGSSRSPRATRAARSRPTPRSRSPAIWLGYALGADGPDRGSGRAGTDAPWSSTLPTCTRLTSAASGWRRPRDIRTRPCHSFSERSNSIRSTASPGSRSAGPTSSSGMPRRRSGAWRRPWLSKDSRGRARRRARPATWASACDAWASSIARGPGVSRGSRRWSGRTSCTATRFAASVSAPSAARRSNSAMSPPPAPPSRRRSRTCAAGLAASAGGTCSSRRWPGSRAQEPARPPFDEALALLRDAERARLLVHVGLHRRRLVARALARGRGAGEGVRGRRLSRRGARRGLPRGGLAPPGAGGARPGARRAGAARAPRLLPRTRPSGAGRRARGRARAGRRRRAARRRRRSRAPRPSGSGRSRRPAEHRVEQGIADPAHVARGARAVDDAIHVDAARGGGAPRADGDFDLVGDGPVAQDPRGAHREVARGEHLLDRARGRRGRPVPVHVPPGPDVAHEPRALGGVEPLPQRGRRDAQRADDVAPVAARSRRATPHARGRGGRSVRSCGAAGRGPGASASAEVWPLPGTWARGSRPCRETAKSGRRTPRAARSRAMSIIVRPEPSISTDSPSRMTSRDPRTQGSRM